MKRTKRKISAVEALSKIRTAPKVTLEAGDTHSRYSTSGLTAFRHRYEEEQFEPVRKATQELSATLSKLIEDDSSTLYSAESQFLAATAPSIGEGTQFDGVSSESIRATIRKSFSTWEDSNVKGKLTQSGREKMQRCARANLNIDSTQVAAWQQIFTLLRQSGELQDQGDSDQPDLIVTEIPDETAQRAGLESLESLDLSSRSGQRIAREIANSDYFGREGAAMFAQWEAHIYRDYGVTLTDEQKKAVVTWLMKWNKNPLSHTSWNEARRALGKAQIIPLMVTDDEVLAERIEHSNLNDRDARMEFAAESRRILGR